MNNLKPVSFLVPVIALILIVVFFIILLKEAGNKAAFKRFTLIVTGLAFLLNFAWEVIQMPLYKGATYNVKQIAFCALASVADALMVLLLYMCFALLNNKPLLVGHLTLFTLFLMMFAGTVGAILAEKLYVSSGNWTYTKAMPIIPVANVGLSPVLQFMFLPVLIYYLSSQILKKGISKN